MISPIFSPVCFSPIAIYTRCIRIVVEEIERRLGRLTKHESVFVFQELRQIVKFGCELSHICERIVVALSGCRAPCFFDAMEQSVGYIKLAAL